MAMTRWMIVLAVALVACRRNVANDFKAKLEPSVAAFLCDHDRAPDQLPIYYRQCFTVDEQQCTEVMRRKVHECAEQIVPDTVDKHNAGTVAERVGACAGMAYDLELTGKGKHIDSKECEIARAAYIKGLGAPAEQASP